MRPPHAVIVVAVLGCTLVPAGWSVAPDPLAQVREDFSADPGWEGVNNRIECSDCPTVTQGFGWSAGSHAGGAGEIGGTIWQSRTSAWYGLPLGRPLTFRDRLSASGKIAFTPGEFSGAAYIGFFNSARQEWRPWNSMAIRIGGEGGGKAGMHIDTMTARWNAAGFETDILLPADGSVHTWRFDYDPEATMPEKWPDARLQGYLTRDRQTAEQVFEKARKAELGATLEQVRSRLRDALALGLVCYLRRSRGTFWFLNSEWARSRGAVSIQVDGERPYRFYTNAEHQNTPVSLDRFGIFNFQLYHRPLRFYVSDLSVNGKKVDLSRDPGWEGRGNAVTFVERDFQRQDFGYSETNWAGRQIGEIGGVFYRVEPVDPLHGCYADEVGRLTLDDPLSFSGNVCFVNGGTDAAMFIGYFNAKEERAEITDEHGGSPLSDSMGLVVDGPSRIGYYLNAVCSPKRSVASAKSGPIFLPTGDRRAFRVDYDPTANNGVGRMTVGLDQETFALDLKPQQRAAGATFDRFGLASVRAGGKYVTLYFDDLAYTARRAPDYRRVRHEQKVLKVPYPPGGRKY